MRVGARTADGAAAPRPHCPLSFRPQANTSPLAVTANEWWKPAPGCDGAYVRGKARHRRGQRHRLPGARLAALPVVVQPAGEHRAGVLQQQQRVPPTARDGHHRRRLRGRGEHHFSRHGSRPAGRAHERRSRPEQRGRGSSSASSPAHRSKGSHAHAGPWRTAYPPCLAAQSRRSRRRRHSRNGTHVLPAGACGGLARPGQSTDGRRPITWRPKRYLLARGQRALLPVACQVSARRQGHDARPRASGAYREKL